MPPTLDRASADHPSDREVVQARFSADQDQDTRPPPPSTQAPGLSPKTGKTCGGNGQTKLLQKDMSQ